MDQQGHTPLDEALEAGHQGAVESLLPPEDKATDPPPAVAVGPANGVVAAAGGASVCCAGHIRACMGDCQHCLLRRCYNSNE